MVPRPKNLTDEERNLCVQFILQHSKNGKPKYGRLLEAQNIFQVLKETVARIWKAAREQQAQGIMIHIISKKKGRKRDHNKQPDYPLISSLPLSSRSSFRRMELELDVSRATLSRWYKAGMLRAHTSSMKPSLTEQNKFTRIRFSLEALELDRVMNRLRFSSMHNIIHIDEKWFYITKGSHR